MRIGRSWAIRNPGARWCAGWNFFACFAAFLGAFAVKFLIFPAKEKPLIAKFAKENPLRPQR
jgi:hypothetical protein